MHELLARALHPRDQLRDQAARELPVERLGLEDSDQVLVEHEHGRRLRSVSVDRKAAVLARDARRGVARFESIHPSLRLSLVERERLTGLLDGV